MEKRKIIRLKGYDYSQSGAYFITICTHDKKCILGNIVDDNVGAVSGRPNIKLSQYGKIAYEAINNIEKYYNNIFVDKYIIMPNHIHLILMINTNENGRPMTAPTLSDVINQFKGYVTKQCSFKVWQRSYHDHIIRNQDSYDEIWQYIDTNALKWELDKYHME